MDTLTVLNLQIHGHGMSLFFRSFFQDCFIVCKCLGLLLNLVCFILFDAIASRIV